MRGRESRKRQALKVVCLRKASRDGSGDEWLRACEISSNVDVDTLCAQNANCAVLYSVAYNICRSIGTR